MADKPRMAGEATRRKLREAGVLPEIAERPGLTVNEANEAMRDHQRAIEETAQGPPPSSFKGSSCIPIHPEDGVEDLVVAGPHHHKKAILAALRRHEYEPGRGRAWAVLVPEPENRHDKLAVAVFVDGQKVGYVDAETAGEIQPALLRIKQQLGSLICCVARIKVRDQTWANVYLDITEKSIAEQAPKRASKGKAGQKDNEGSSCLGSCLALFLMSFLAIVVIGILVQQCDAGPQTRAETARISAGATFRCDSPIRAVDARDRSRSTVFEPPIVITIKSVRPSGDIEADISRTPGEAWGVILKRSDLERAQLTRL